MSDRLVGGALILLALAFIAGATQIEVALIFESLGPKAFPIMIGAGLVVASLFLLLRPDPEPEWPKAGRLGEIALVVVIMVAYGHALEPFGFVAATAVASAVLSWRLGAALVSAVPIGIGVAVVIYVIFQHLLGLSLAKGPWGF